MAKHIIVIHSPPDTPPL